MVPSFLEIYQDRIPDDLLVKTLANNLVSYQRPLWPKMGSRHLFGARVSDDYFTQSLEQDFGLRLYGVPLLDASIHLWSCTDPICLPDRNYCSEI